MALVMTGTIDSAVPAANLQTNLVGTMAKLQMASLGVDCVGDDAAVGETIADCLDQRSNGCNANP